MENKNFEYKITKDIINKIKILIYTKELISYKELCQKLNWKVSKGNQKIKQIKILEQEFEFEYIGEHSYKKFLFTGIKEKNILIKPLINNRDYTIIDVIIMEYLNINTSLTGSLIKICTKLNIIHKNFLLSLNNSEKISEFLGYNKKFLEKFLENTSKKIRDILKRSLERLKENGYITVEKQTYVKFIGAKYPFHADQKTFSEIQKAKYDTIKNLGYSCYEEVKKNKKILIYNKMLNEEIKKYNIDFFYNHYIIDKKSKKSEKITINKKNIIQINENIIKKFTKSFKNKGNNNDYLSNKFLIDNIIDIKSTLNIKDMLLELENEDEE